MATPDPIALFAEVFARAARTALDLPADHTAAALATVGADAMPSVRIVLVRRFDERGFVFFTNYESRKAGEIDANPRAALCFYWHWIDEQVRVEGAATRIADGESDDYFASRPRGSQIGAWASAQSRELPSRAQLDERYEACERQYASAVVPRPPFWGGYRLEPVRIEFWKAGASRLHDRTSYTRDASGWQQQLLYP